jgi:hypothetical protein
MESSVAQPDKSKLVTSHGDVQDLTKEGVAQYGITLCSSRLLQEEKTDAKKFKDKDASSDEDNAIFMRFKRTKDTEYRLSVDRLSFQDLGTTKSFTSNMVFHSGIHTWELIFPIGITGVEFGVQCQKSEQKFFRKFKTTTPRFVAITLDVEGKKITYRLNKDPFTDKVVALSTEGPFSPWVNMTKQDIPVVLNPYPRLLPHQKIMGRQFNLKKYLKSQLSSTLALTHMPRGLGVNNDSAYINKCLGMKEKDILSVHLPKDNSHFQYLKGWALVTLKEDKYEKWATSSFTLEGRKVVIHPASELIEYAADKGLQESLRGETLQVAEYVFEQYGVKEGEANPSAVFKALDELFSKAKEAQRGPKTEQDAGLTIHKLNSEEKVLVVHHEGKAKVVDKSMAGYGMNFQGGIKNSEDMQMLTCTVDEFNVLFSHFDWNSISDLHICLEKSFLNFFTHAKESVKLIADNLLEMMVPAKDAKLVLDQLLHTSSKLRFSRSREFEDLAVIGMDHLKVNRNKEQKPVDATLESTDIYRSSQKDVSLHDINRILNILYKFDEQCWCRAMFLPTDKETTELMTSTSRPFSTFNRLSTFIGLDKKYHDLANYGYVYRGDKVFQNVHNDAEITQISPNCQDKVADTLVLKNSVNVPLAESLSYLPPTAIKKNRDLTVSQVSDFVFTVDKKGVATIYTADLGLVEAGQIDFNSIGKESKALSVENKKYLGSLINYEISNAKAKLNFSATHPINIAKAELEPIKGGDVINKYLPSKAKTVQISKKVVKNAHYDEEDNISDMAGLFGDEDEEYEDVCSDDEPIREETKEEEETEEKKEDEVKEEEVTSTKLGYNFTVHKNYLNQELQGVASCVFEQDGKIQVDSRTFSIDIPSNYLKEIDYNKYVAGTNAQNKKKNQEKVCSEVVQKYRSSIVHQGPLFHSHNFNDPILTSGVSTLNLSEKLSKVLAVSRTNGSLEETTSFYILGTDKDGKVTLLKIQYHLDGVELKVTIEGETTLDLDQKEAYTIVNKNGYVAIVSTGKVLLLKEASFDEKLEHKISKENVLEQVNELIEKEIKLKEEVKKDEDEEPKQDISVDLLKDGDCDLKELDQIFVSKPMRVVSNIKSVLDQQVIEDNFEKESKDFDKLNLKFFFNSKSQLTQEKDFVSQSQVQYKSKESNHVYEELSNIDLRVHSNTGSQVNQSHPPVALIDPHNEASYISNYPRPTIVFTHHKEVDFLPSQVTVSSKVHREKANSDSYPMGAGLIFCATSLKDLENVKKYYQIQTRVQYERWLESRQNVKLPLQDNEPVAFFELGSENEVTVNLSLDRPCKYILLMPTDFRKKPIKFTKRFYSNNCEIESFKVVGREVKISSEAQNDHFESEIVDNHVETGASAIVQIKKNGEWEDFTTLRNLKVTHIESLTNSYCMSLFDRTKSCVTGSSSFELSLSDVKDAIQGIRVKINEPDGNKFWQFKDSHFIVYKYPSELKFKSKGLRRINESSILELYNDNTKLGEFVKKLITIVQDKNELEHTRNSLLQHLNRLKSHSLVQTLKENFDYKSFFEDPDLYTYSDSFKTTVFKTLNKIGLTSSDSEDQSFFTYTSGLLRAI